MAYNHDNELFLRPDSSSQPERETPEPLRILKKNTGGASSGEEPSEQWASYRLPATAYGAPTSPPPTGPLPYPDERSRTHPAMRPSGQQDQGTQRQSMVSDASSGASSGGRRAKFEGNDPNRPSAGGYGISPTLGMGRIAERRGTPVKSITPNRPDSPGGPEPPHKSPEPRSGDDTGTLFAIPLNRPTANAPVVHNDSDLREQYYPPPLGGISSSGQSHLQIPEPRKAGISRLDSTASVSTTKAARGSPPPPETPAVDTLPSNGLTGIEARYAASGIAGTNTLNEIQAQSGAAAARRAQYGNQQSLSSQQPTTTGGRWSPSEHPGSGPHGPPIMFQGNEEVLSTGNSQPSQGSRSDVPAHQLANDIGRMNLQEEPPPAYSPPAPGTAQSQYPNEKGRYAAPQQQQQPQPQEQQQSAQQYPSQEYNSSAFDSKTSLQDPNIRQHPAFANDSQQVAQGFTPSPQPGAQQHPGISVGMHDMNMQRNQATSPQPSGAGPASPPPLPEGWIAHLDNNSGQYYYIHLPTQSTQWEFPKGPTPLSLQEPMSPVGTYYNNPLKSPVGSLFTQPIASPGFATIPMSAGYDGRQSMMSVLASPTATAFTGPPPTAGVDLYKIAPTNGVYFGPFLRYTNIDLERGLWLGSIMLITDAAQPPTIHIHQSVDLSPNPRQLKAHPIHSHQRWIFYRYDIDLHMEEGGSAKWTYAITSHLGCTRYEFLVAGRYEASWRFVAHSGNDFAINVSANERTKLGGVPLVWKDVLLKHQECGGFHTQIGLGGQIYADRLWKDIPALKQWTQTSGKENRKNAQWTPKLDEDVTHAYFHYYTSHFDQPAVREAFAQIPQVCCLDDHDIFDGYGSYPEYMQQSHMFMNIGRIGIDMYLLFQHHTNHEILRNVNNDVDLFTITGHGWHFLKYFGPNVVVVGPDTRSERTTTQVMAGKTYQGLFPKVAVLPPSVQHCIWLFPVPLVYPRLETVEQMASTVATGKKLVTGAFNMAGKVTGGLAGVVGAKGAVNSGFEGVKRAVGKSGLMQGVLNPFGEVDFLDELRDLWTHESKDLERTYIIRTLQGIAHNKSLRMTFLSGSVNVCGAGLVHDPTHPSDHKTMYQLITSSIVNAPQPSYVLKFLHSNKPLYIPQNGHRSSPAVSDTKEDMMEIFGADVDGRPRDLRRLMGRRNYLVCVAFDPEMVQDQHGAVARKGGNGRLSLAAEFMVQNEGLYGQAMKYGPVVIPSLEYGR